MRTPAGGELPGAWPREHAGAGAWEICAAHLAAPPHSVRPSGACEERVSEAEAGRHSNSPLTSRYSEQVPEKLGH